MSAAADQARAADAGLGAVELEIIRNALVAAAEEMSVTVWRTSRSSVVREILDYSTCVFDADGRSVAQAARMPVHLNSMASCLLDVVAGPMPLERWHPGDVVLTNDPYSGGQHLNDWLAFSPVFVDGRRVAIAGVLVHHLDVGGGAPGSYDPEATEVFGEGVRIPPVKVVDAGVRNEALVETILRNSRAPVSVGGDFASQLAALRIGVQTLERVARRYGPTRWTSPRAPSRPRARRRSGRPSRGSPTASTASRTSSTTTASTRVRCRSACAWRSRVTPSTSISRARRPRLAGRSTAP